MTQEFHSFFLGILTYQTDKNYANPVLIDLEMSNGSSSGFLVNTACSQAAFLLLQSTVQE